MLGKGISFNIVNIKKFVAALAGDHGWTLDSSTGSGSLKASPGVAALTKSFAMFSFLRYTTMGGSGKRS